MLVGSALTVAVARGGASGPNAGSAGSDARADPGATEDFLASWRRSRLGTWAVVLRFERRVGGGELVAEQRVVQRPPDRLAVGLGSVDVRRHGRRFGCTAGSDGVPRCRDGGPAPPYEQELEAELALLRGYLRRPNPLYVARRDGRQCFTLRLTRSIPAPPYGRRARFCFDPPTGAPVLTEVRRSEGTDIQRAVDVRREVSDGDLEPPPGAGAG